MNFVRRSLGAAALTFCGMLSLHADTVAVVQPVTAIQNITAENIGQKVTDFKAALKQVLANTLRTSLIDQEAGFKRSSVRQAIAAKETELIAASTTATEHNKKAVAAGYKTADIIEVEDAAAAFEAKLVLLKTLRKDVAHDSVVNYINAVKAYVNKKNMITLLNIAKRCNGLDNAAKAELLKQRDELKIGQSLKDILIVDLCRSDIAEQDYKDYIANFTITIVNAIPTMTAAQANKAHMYTLAEARIVARAARKARLADVDVDAFDAQILQAKADLTARFHAANQEEVERLAKPGLISKAAKSVGNVAYHATVTPAYYATVAPVKATWNGVKAGWNWAFSGKKGAGLFVEDANSAFNDINRALHGLVAPDVAADGGNVDAVIAYFQALRVQAEELHRVATADDFAAEAQRANLHAVYVALGEKVKACFATKDAAQAYLNSLPQNNTRQDLLAHLSLVGLRSYAVYQARQDDCQDIQNVFQTYTFINKFRNLV
ncbi:hypothetical protein JST56_00970 [Candidatus Dependentiae bacterium]|nr:hypothetical protein [Candidatus Dependentiae bacterium]